MRAAAFGVIAAAAWLALAAPAMAHVEVLPSTVTQGQATEFTVRVPTERNLPTTQVRIDFPSQVTVYSFADPPPGWTLRPILSRDGRSIGVIYEGGRIAVGRYADFHFLGTPFGSGTAIWRARQRYADGLVKPWTGPPETPGRAEPESGSTAPGPASAVTIARAGASTSPAAPAASSGGGDDSGAGVWLGIIAIGISALAALGVGLLWSTRPARLPGDDDKS